MTSWQNAPVVSRDNQRPAWESAPVIGSRPAGNYREPATTQKPSYIVDTAKGVYRGVNRALANTLGLLNTIGDAAARRTGDFYIGTDGFRYVSPEEYRAGKRVVERTPFEAAEAGINAHVDNIGESRTVPGKFAEEATRFVVGFIPANRALKGLSVLNRASKTSTAARYAVAGAVSDVVTTAGHDERLSNIIQQYPALQNPVTEFLAANEDDGEIEGRLKAAVEGIIAGEIVGFVGRGLVKGTKGLYAEAAKLSDDFVIGIKAVRAARRTKAQLDGKTVAEPRVGFSKYVGTIKNVDDLPDIPAKADAKPIMEADGYRMVETDETGIYRLESAEDPASRALFRERADGTIVSINIGRSDKLKGKGFGRNAVTILARRATERGASYLSDTEVTTAAARMYRALKKDGLDVVENQNVEVVEGVLKSTDGRPVFSIRTATPGTKPLPAGKGFSLPDVADVVRRQPEQAKKVADRIVKDIGQPHVAFERLGLNRPRIGWSSIGDPVEAERVLDEVASGYQSVIDNLGPERETFEMTVNQSGELLENLSPEQILAGGGKDQYGNAAWLLATRTLLLDSAKEIARLTSAVKKGVASESDKVDLIGQIQLSAAIYARQRQAQRDAARAVSAGRIIAKARKDGQQAMLDAARSLGLPLDDTRWMGAFDRPGMTPTDVTKAAVDLANGNWRGWWWQMIYGNLLSNPKTHIVNTLGNTVNVIYGLFDNAVGSVFGAVRRSIGAAPEDTTPWRAALDYSVGVVHGLTDAVRLPIYKVAKAAADNGWKFSSEAVRKELAEVWTDGTGTAWKAFAQGRALTSAMAGKTENYSGVVVISKLPAWAENAGGWQEAAGRGLIKLANAAGQAFAVPTRLLAAGDEVFARMAVRGRAQVTVKQMVDVELAHLDGLIPEDAKERFAEGLAEDLMRGVLDPDAAVENPGLASVLREDALKAGRRATFTETTADMGGYGVAVESFQKFVGAVPGLRYFFPFIRTPASILKQVVWDRSPLGGIGSVVSARKAAKGAKAIAEEVSEVGLDAKSPVNLRSIKDRILWTIAQGGEEAELMAARATVGTGVLWLGYELYANGRLTGTGLRGPDSRDGNGPLPASIKIGETWYGINRLDPIGWSLTMVASVAEAIDVANREDDVDPTDVIAAALVSLMQSLHSKSFFMGLSVVSALLEGKEYAAENAVESIQSALVPYGALLGQAERSLDPVASEVEGIFDDFWSNVRSRIPYLSRSESIKRDWLGRPVESPTSAFLSPLPVSKDSSDPMEQELYRLNVRVPVPERKMEHVRLSAEQYSRYLELRGQGIKIGGLTMEEAIRREVTSPRYKALAFDDGRRERIEDIVRKYQSRAKLQLLKEFPALRAEMDAKAKRRRERENARAAAEAEANQPEQTKQLAALSEALGLN